MPKKVLLLATLLGLPLLSFAQTAPSSTGFYVGVGANLLTDLQFRAGTSRLVGPSLTAGIQLSPRLALQASASYHWEQHSYDNPSYYYGSSGAVVGGGTNTYKYKYLTAPVLLRYTFTEPAARFHVDGLAGITVLYGHFNYTSTNPAGGYYYYPNDYSSSSTRAAATLGPAVRYNLSPQVALTANGLVSATLGKSYYNFSDRLFLNVLVGAQYTFGQ